MPATKNKKVSPQKRGKRPSSTKSTKQNEEKAREKLDYIYIKYHKNISEDILNGIMEDGQVTFEALM